MPFKNGHVPKNKILNRPHKVCEACKQLFKMRMGISYLQWEKRRFCSCKCRAKIINPFMKGHKINNGRIPTLEHRKKVGEANKGEKSHFWKGGVTKQGQLIRSSAKFREWREAVFKRDNWTCVWCGFKGYVQADHIKPFAHFPELRFEVGNGQTLCRDCHKKTDTFAYKARKQYEKYK